MTVRRLSSPDPVLHRIGPFGLAAAAGTALVVDLDPTAAPYPGPTLADLLREGVTARQLSPRTAGVAVVGSGGVTEESAGDLLDALVSGWPAVVCRVPHGRASIQVLPLDPPEIRPPDAFRAVWQSSTRGSRAPGVVLPPVGRSRMRAMCSGRVEPRWAWVRAWAPVWESAWT